MPKDRGYGASAGRMPRQRLPKAASVMRKERLVGRPLVSASEALSPFERGSQRRAQRAKRRDRRSRV